MKKLLASLGLLLALLLCVSLVACGGNTGKDDPFGSTQDVDPFEDSNAGKAKLVEIEKDDSTVKSDADPIVLPTIPLT